MDYMLPELYLLTLRPMVGDKDPDDAMVAAALLARYCKAQLLYAALMAASVQAMELGSYAKSEGFAAEAREVSKPWRRLAKSWEVTGWWANGVAVKAWRQGGLA